MTSRMRKRVSRASKASQKVSPILKGFHAPQRDNSKRQKKKNKDYKEDQ